MKNSSAYLFCGNWAVSIYTIIECNDTGISRPIALNGVTGFFDARYDGTSNIVVSPWDLQVDLQYRFRYLE